MDRAREPGRHPSPVLARTADRAQLRAGGHDHPRSAILGLQASAGNHATARLLQRMPPAAGPVLQRLVHWDTSTNPNTVASITLDRLSGTGGGAHSTAYQLFLETVQNAVIAADYETAIKRLNALHLDVKQLPGWKTTNTKRKTKIRNLAAEFADDYADASTVQTIAAPANHSYYLEILAGDFVKLRNALEYNYLEAGEGGIGGWNEAQHLRGASRAHIAVDWSTIAADMQVKKPTTGQKRQRKDFADFIEESAALVDTRKVVRPTKKRKVWDDRWSNIVQQHVATIIATHPGVDEAAELVVDHLVENLGDTIGLRPTRRQNVVNALSTQAGWSNIGLL